MITREKLLDFFRSQLGISTSALTDETTLFSSGLIDSFSLVSMMSFLESEGRFRISLSDVSLENMDTIGRILRYAERMRA